METIVGIDLGTTNSAIAIMENDEVKIIQNKHGDPTTPSIVAFTNEGNILIGKEAKNQAASNPKKTISSAKRVIGRRVMEVPDAAKKVSYSLVGRPSDPVQILIGDSPENQKAFMPQSISARILQNLKKSAEDYLGRPVTDAVITVPAYFNDGQRQATKRAGELAGLNVRRIINEPTAAALAYGINVEDDTLEKKVVVFDLGGGTFDISILEIGGGVWEVKSTNGDTFLGGDDFDREIVNLLVRSFLNKPDGVDLREYPSAMQRLKEAAENAKFVLSSNLEAKITQAFLTEELGENGHLEFVLSRSKFESLIDKYMKRIENCCKQALKDANISSSEITDVVLVGGSTRIPLVRDIAKKIFGKDPDTSVNPDEVVALGAAIQGAILSGTKKGMILVDVTPLSLGIETEHEIMDTLIPRNTSIPCVAKEIYTTTEDEQEEVDVFVYQGESRRVTRNRLLGQFVLDGIEPAYEGDPQIEVRFAIDADGILQVSAKNLATGSEQIVTIKGCSSLSDEDVLKFQSAAEQDQYDTFEDFEEDDDDEDYYDLDDITQVAEALLQDTTNGIDEFSGVLDNATLQEIKKAKAALAEALDEEDMDLIETSLDSLLTLWDSIEATLED